MARQSGWKESENASRDAKKYLEQCEAVEQSTLMLVKQLFPDTSYKKIAAFKPHIHCGECEHVEGGVCASFQCAKGDALTKHQQACMTFKQKGWADCPLCRHYYSSGHEAYKCQLKNLEEIGHPMDQESFEKSLDDMAAKRCPPEVSDMRPQVTAIPIQIPGCKLRPNNKRGR